MYEGVTIAGGRTFTKGSHCPHPAYFSSGRRSKKTDFVDPYLPGKPLARLCSLCKFLLPSCLEAAPRPTGEHFQSHFCWLWAITKCFFLWLRALQIISILLCQQSFLMAGIPGQTLTNSQQFVHDMIYPKVILFKMVLSVWNVALMLWLAGTVF